MATKPVLHGPDHRGIHPASGVPGPDPARLQIDSTANVGTDQGVGSYSATSGHVLTADGSGGSHWAAGGGGGIGAQIEFLTGTVTAAAGATNQLFTFVHEQGVSGLLDLAFAGATQPTFGSGVWSWFGTAVTLENVNVRRQVRATMTIVTPTFVMGDGGPSTADDVNADLGYMKMGGSIEVTASSHFQMLATNYDSISHDFYINFAWMRWV